MGQTSSRARRPALLSQVRDQHQQDGCIESSAPVSIPPPPVATATLDAEPDVHAVAMNSQSHPHNQPSQKTTTAITRSSQRSSVRKSLIHLVQPVTTAVRGRGQRNRLDAENGLIPAGEGTVGVDQTRTKDKKRMSWRRSRTSSKRWSKSRWSDTANRLQEEEDGDSGEANRSFPVVTRSDDGETRGASTSMAGAVASTSTTQAEPTFNGMESFKGKEKENQEGESEQPTSAPDLGLETNHHDSRGLEVSSDGTGKARSSTTTSSSSQVPVDILRAPHVHPIPLPSCTSEPSSSHSLSPSAAAPYSMDHSDNTTGHPQQGEGSSMDHHYRYRREFSPVGLSALPPMARAMATPMVPPSPLALPRSTAAQQRAGAAPGSNSRQFPPPGTLVVVQGIVHTTDVSRSDGGRNNSNHANGPATTSSGAGSNDVSTSSAQDGNSDDEDGLGRAGSQQLPSSAVNRLSAMLGRGVGGGDASSSSVVVGETETEQHQREQQQQSQSSSSDQARSTSIISSNSLDVLGTLLGVAAAATAASLLTGSSEPILSSGLASNPTADSTMNSVSSPPTSTGDAAAITGANTPAPLPFHPATLSPRRSTSSASASSATVTPSTWIPDHYVHPSSSSSHVPSFVSASYTRSPISGINDESSAGRTERMRQAWSTIRERLGLGGGHVSSMPSSAPLSSTSTSSSLLPITVSGTSTTSNSGNANSMGLPSSSSSSPTTTTASSNVGVGGTAATSSTLSASATTNAERWDGRERERTLRTDTREQMLAEMTRVFNNGFGLSPNASTPGVEDFRNGSRRRGEEREVPPEGSFERFLAELQTDMRIALIQGHQSGDRGEGEREVPGQQGREDVSANNAQETLRGAVVVEGEREHRENELRSLGPLEESQEQEGSTDDDMPSLQDVSNDSSSEDNVVPSQSQPPESMPEPSQLTSTLVAEPVPARDDDHQDAVDSTRNASASTTEGNTVSRSSVDASGRINWWRLYRFPPVASTVRPGLGLGQVLESTLPARGPSSSSPSPSFPSVVPTGTPVLSESGPLRFPPPLTSVSPPPLSSSSPDMNINDLSAQNENVSPFTSNRGDNGHRDHAGNTVVPVIIVGLQSVNAPAPNWRSVVPVDGMGSGDIMDEAQHMHHTHHLRQRHQAARNMALGMMGSGGDGEDEYDRLSGGSPFGSNHGGGSRQRGEEGGRSRGWQNRAASAFRNLRPGGVGGENRRGQGLGSAGGGGGGAGGFGLGAGADLPPIGVPGSRTFLIYVIGGYYPPDHSIVTGGPDDLDSFEALLELVELLGNAKSSTASREDIERSGLEVIKRSQLEEYEKSKKISSNCAERCLICLEDYKEEKEEEEEIRVMRCRHAFHRACVDTWLQTGKNNCPACRSTGVSTDSTRARSPSPSPSPSPAVF